MIEYAAVAKRFGATTPLGSIALAAVTRAAALLATTELCLRRTTSTIWPKETS